MDEQRCVKCGGRLSRRARICLKCGTPRPSSTVQEVEEHQNGPVPEPVQPNWIDTAPQQAERSPEIHLEPATPWVDSAGSQERAYGAPEPAGAAKALGVLAAVRGEVTQVGDVRQQRITRPLLVLTLFLLLATLLLVLSVLGFLFRAIIAIVARHPSALAGGRGGMVAMVFGPAANLFSQEIPVLPFRVTSQDGKVVECLLRGSVWGGSVGLGDSVEASGVWARGAGATLDVRRVRNLTTGALTSARLPFGVLRGGYGWLISAAVLAVLVLLLFRACVR